MIKFFIVFFGISISVFVLVLLARKTNKKQSDGLLAAWFLTALVHLIFYLLGDHSFLKEKHLLIAVGNALPVLHIFIIAAYVDQLRSRVIKQLLFGYATIFILYVAALFYMSITGSILQEGAWLNFSHKAATWMYFIPPSFLLIYLVACFYILRSIKLYRFNLKSIYSSVITTNTAWLAYWLWSYAIGSIIIVMAVLNLDFGTISSDTAYMIVTSVLAAQVFLVGQLGVTRNFVFPKASGEYTKYRASGLKNEEKTSRKAQLLKYLDEDKPYLDSNLSLHQLAKELSIPPYQLSQLINESLNTNFFDLINEYRVQEFKRRIQDESYNHLSILGIAFDSGFNSKSGFYKSFRKLTGISPSQYKHSK